MRILIVDDEVIVAEDLALQLKEKGFLVTGIASSAAEAVRSAVEKPPDVILMDIRLKGEVNGVEAAAIIQKQAKRRIGVLFLSAYDRRQFDGIDQIPYSIYLNKPVQIDQLLDAIHTVRSSLPNSNGSRHLRN